MMATFSSTLNEEKNISRSDPSRMYNIGQTPLARLRPEKLDDMTIKNHISLIQEVCRDVDPELIALVFHECDYNMQTTIARIEAGDYGDGGWQKAKSNNKKKNHNNLGEQISNSNTLNDHERTSPTSSLRGAGGHYRQEHPSTFRANPGRRGNDPGRNYSIPTNPRYPPRNYSNSNNTTTTTKPLPTQQNPSEPIPSSKPKEEITPTSSSVDEYEFVGGTTQSLTFDNSLKTSVLSAVKRSIPSAIPQQPVSMHPTVHFSTEPIDIQFGDVQWNDSLPIAVTPSTSSVLTKSLDNQQSSSVTTTHDYKQQADAGNSLSSSYINHQATNETDRELLETTNRLSTSSLSSSLPITNNILANNLVVVPVEGTSHLSDHLTDSLQQQVPLQMTSSSSSLTDSTRLPPTSTPNASEYTSPTAQTNNQFLANNLQPSLSNTNNSSGGNLSAFAPYNTPGAFQPVTRDYSQTASTWNQQVSNYKPISKSTMIQPGNYAQQASYQIPPQQQYIFGTYPYPTTTLYPVLTTSVDPWSTAGFESYPTYPTTNYIPQYPAQPQYHSATVQPTKYDSYPYDKDFFVRYGQPRLSINELPNSSQTTKDTPMGSKLSATAATFSQGAPLTTANPATAVLLNPVLYTVPTYYTSHQDRSMSYPTIDHRDNRNGALYGGNNNRNHYYQQQQQRTHNNSTWHSQQ